MATYWTKKIQAFDGACIALMNNIFTIRSDQVCYERCDFLQGTLEMNF